MDSRALIETIKKGDTSVGEKLVEEFQVKVYNICMSLLHDHQDAEDVTQDVFIEVLKGLPKYRGDAEPGTWIYRIAVNRSLNFIRNNKKRKWWKQIDELLSFSSERADDSNSSFRSYEPFVDEEILEQKEQRDVLKKAIDSLPESQRVAFTLHKIDDMPYLQIAEVMNISHSAVESLIHRARMALRSKLAVYYEKIRN
jgi:RNA polymerase sigma-70 factor (ECF subfamily)